MLKRFIQQVRQIIDDRGNGEESLDPEAIAEFRTSLVNALRNPPPAGVVVDDHIEVCGIAPEDAYQVCEEVYLSFARKVAADGVITDSERAKLQRLAETLGIGPADAGNMETVAAIDVYRAAVKAATVDYQIEFETADELAQLRRSLGITIDPGPAERAAFREGIIRLFKRTNPSGFDLEQYARGQGIAMAAASEVAEDLYSNFARKVMADGLITEQERKSLATLASVFRIAPNLAAWIESQAKEEVYRAAVISALADGVISPIEAVKLDSLRKSLGISSREGEMSSSGVAGDAYRSMIWRMIDQCEVDEHSLAQLDRFKKTLSLSKSSTREMIAGDAGAIYRKAAMESIQDDVIEDREERLLAWLREETGVSESEIADITEKIALVKKLAQYRHGRIPTFPTRRLLEGGEICH